MGLSKLSTENIEQQLIITEILVEDIKAIIGTSFTKGSVLFSDGFTIKEDNSNLFWDDVNDTFSLGDNTPDTSNIFYINPPARADVTTGNGTTGKNLIGTAGGKGGKVTVTDGSAPTGGKGGGVRLSGGLGGESISNTGLSIGGGGGDTTLIAGTGGTASSTGTGDVIGGGGGVAQMKSGGGKAITSTNTGGDNTGGSGGRCTFRASNGGSASGSSTSNTGGNGGDLDFEAGRRGTGSGTGAANGTHGDMTFIIGVGQGIMSMIGETLFAGILTSSPVTTFDINGGIALNLVSKTANYTATTSDHTIICGAGNESFTITLPAVSGVSGIIYNIKNIGTGTITVDGASSETIDGATTAVISSQFGSITIQCDGTEWWII